MDIAGLVTGIGAAAAVIYNRYRPPPMDLGPILQQLERMDIKIDALSTRLFKLEADFSAYEKHSREEDLVIRENADTSRRIIESLQRQMERLRDIQLGMGMSPPS